MCMGGLGGGLADWLGLVWSKLWKGAGIIRPPGLGKCFFCPGLEGFRLSVRNDFQTVTIFVQNWRDWDGAWRGRGRGLEWVFYYHEVVQMVFLEYGWLFGWAGAVYSEQSRVEYGWKITRVQFFVLIFWIRLVLYYWGYNRWSVR